MFNAIQVINLKYNQNIVVNNCNENIAGNTNNKIEFITDHFKKQFYKDIENPFQQITPKNI